MVNAMSPITLRPHQIAAADAAENAIAAGISRPLLDMCVASGKSFTYAEIARRAVERRERIIIGAHVRELVEQNAEACKLLMPDVHVGINCSALGEANWRAPVICASIQSVFRYPERFGTVDRMIVDEAHLLPHNESGMYNALYRGLRCPPMTGGSGTTFRLQGGSLVEGEKPPFDCVVYTYSILDGIRDGYLVPPISLEADDKLDATKLRTRNGEYTGESQDDQMLTLMDSHIQQIIHYGRDRRAWLIFEASAKAAKAMCKRMNEWGIPTGLVLGTTSPEERRATIAAYRAGRLRACVNVNALTTGSNIPEIDLEVMRRRTKSIGLYIQMVGRCLRTIGGNLPSSIASGKADGAVLDFAGNIDQHGPLDCITPVFSKARFTSCEDCGKRNPSAAMRCMWCGAEMTKNCPACLTALSRGIMQCTACNYDMRSGARDAPAEKLLDRPSGAALLSSHKTPGEERSGGWIPIRKAWEGGAVDDVNGDRWDLPGPLVEFAAAARWIRKEPLAIMVPNGRSKASAWQIAADGSRLIIPIPPQIATTGA